MHAVPHKRAAIIDAAKTLFAAEGFHATTTDQIARQAGIAVGTIYNHFGNKEEILSAIFLEARDQRIAWWNELDIQLQAQDCIVAFARRHFASIADDPRLGVILTHQGMVRPAGMTEFQHDLAAAISRRIGSSTDRDDSSDLQIVTVMLMGVLEAIVREGAGLAERREREDYFDKALSILSHAAEAMAPKN